MKKQIHFKQKCLLILACVGFTLTTSCSKSNDPNLVEEIPDEEVSNTNLYYKLVQVRNFAGTQTNDGVNAAPTVFYSLETNKSIPESNRQTRNWDIAFSNIFNSYVSGNNGSNNSNSGFGNNAIGGILIIEKAFEEVTEIPADSQFKIVGDAIGLDQNGSLGNGIGWILYDFDGILVRDHAIQNEHVAYTLGNGLTLKNGKIIKPRTLVVRTAKGNYAKIKPVSLYKDLWSSELWFKDSPHVYISFDYVLIPKGSTKFEVK